MHAALHVVLIDAVLPSSRLLSGWYVEHHGASVAMQRNAQPNISLLIVPSSLLPTPPAG